MATTIANVQGAKTKVDDFMPKFEKKKQSVETMTKICSLIARGKK